MNHPPSCKFMFILLCGLLSLTRAIYVTVGLHPPFVWWHGMTTLLSCVLTSGYATEDIDPLPKSINSHWFSREKSPVNPYHIHDLILKWLVLFLDCLCVEICCLHICKCTTYVFGAHGSQKRILDSPTAGFIDNFERQVGAKNWIHVFCKSSKCH